jgi:hypothetical protein
VTVRDAVLRIAAALRRSLALRGLPIASPEQATGAATAELYVDQGDGEARRHFRITVEELPRQ